MISTQAPSLWALCAHAVLLVVTLTGDKATPRERAPSPEENAIELHQIVGFTWLRGLFDRKAVLKDENLAVEDCVEINQCVGCTRPFFTKSFLGDDAAVLARLSGEEPASPRHRAGVASMAWRTTRRFSTNAP